MKRLLLISFFFFLASVLFVACNEENLRPVTNPSVKQNTNKKPTKQNDTPKTMTDGLTLAEIEADPNTHLQTPGGMYALQMAGIWNYSSAYLLIETSTNKLIGEVYQFNNHTDYVTAGGDCNQVYSQSGNSICCSGIGNTCKNLVFADGSLAIVRCE
jgi:hypothetical protein